MRLNLDICYIEKLIFIVYIPKMLQSTAVWNANNSKDLNMRNTLNSKKIRHSDSSQYKSDFINASVSGITFDAVQSTPKSINLTTNNENKKLRNIKILLQNTSEKPTTIKFLDPLRTAYKEDYRNMQKDTSLVNKMFTSTDTNVYNYQVRTINPIDDDTRDKWGTHFKIPGNNMNSERYLIKTDAFSDASEDKKNDFGVQRKRIIRLQSDTTSSFNRFTKAHSISVLTNKGNVEASHIHIKPDEHTFEDQGDINDAMQQDSYLFSSDIPYRTNMNGGIISNRNLQAAKTRIFDYHHLLKGNDKVNYQPTSEISYAQISKHVPEVRLNPTGRNLLPKFLRMNFRTI